MGHLFDDETDLNMDPVEDFRDYDDFSTTTFGRHPNAERSLVKSGRFAKVEESELNEFVKGRKPANTTKAERTWARVYHDWAKAVDEEVNFCILDVEKLNVTLAKFVKGMRKQNGECYLVMPQILLVLLLLLS